MLLYTAEGRFEVTAYMRALKYVTMRFITINRNEEKQQSNQVSSCIIDTGFCFVYLFQNIIVSRLETRSLLIRLYTLYPFSFYRCTTSSFPTLRVLFGWFLFSLSTEQMPLNKWLSSAKLWLLIPKLVVLSPHTGVRESHSFILVFLLLVFTPLSLFFFLFFFLFFSCVVTPRSLRRSIISVFWPL